MKNSELLLDIIKRVKEIKKVKSDSKAAKSLNMSRNSLYGYKDRESIPYEYLCDFCKREGVRYEYLVNGILPIYEEKIDNGANLLNKATGQYVENLSEAVANHSTNSDQSSYPDSNLPALQKTSEVLETDSIFQKALNSNIEAFHAAIKIRSELNMTKIKLNQCERKIDKQQNDINDLKAEIESLKERLLITESK